METNIVREREGQAIGTQSGAKQAQISEIERIENGRIWLLVKRDKEWSIWISSHHAITPGLFE